MMNQKIQAEKQTPTQASHHDYDYVLKLLIIGDSGVGKSSVMHRFHQNKFSENYMMTIGINYVAKNIQIEQKRIRLQIWDTAGQQKYKTITQNYYRNSDGALIAFSINNRESFQSASTNQDKTGQWLDELLEIVNKSIQVVLVGTKTDLQQQREVSYEEAEEFAKSCSLPYMECSAKSGESVNEVFMLIGKLMKKKAIDEVVAEKPTTPVSPIKIEKPNKLLPNKCC